MSEYTVEINSKGDIAVDDMLLVKDFPAQAGSRMLEGFKPLFTAEAVTRLEEKGYVIAGKTQVGEFGLDLVGEFSYYGKQEGSLKGAAASLVAENKIKAALGVDMTGAPRRAAALGGVDFLKPTYGTVSRYGIISAASCTATIIKLMTEPLPMSKAMVRLEAKSGPKTMAMSAFWLRITCSASRGVATVLMMVKYSDTDKRSTACCVR